MRKKIKNIGNYREKVMRASGIYNDAIMREEYTAAVVAAGQCVEGCMKMFLTMRDALGHQLRESHNAAKLFTECAKLIQVKEQVHPLDLTGCNGCILSEPESKKDGSGGVLVGSSAYRWLVCFTDCTGIKLEGNFTCILRSSAA